MKIPEGKICGRCRCPKPYDDFARNKTVSAGINSWCKRCHAEHQKFMHEQNKVESNRKIQELRAARREELRKFVVQYLNSHPCIKCQEANILCLDFDHRNPDEKEFDISKAISQVPSMERFLKEINKCDVLCANCHRIKTAHDFGHYRIKHLGA